MKKLIALCIMLSITTIVLTVCRDRSGQPVDEPTPQPTMPTTAQPKPRTTIPPQGFEESPSGKTFEQRFANLIIIFSQQNCPYCQYMEPIMKQVEMKFGNKIKFLFVDAAQNPQYSSQYNFRTVPHIVYFKDGKQLDAHGSGDKTMTAQQVEERIKTHFGDRLFKN